ncbi:hypothetical protein, partial [Bilophila sp.]|uniref:hypothetical protein n=1 Tax=Bilophila sp. TaxID=1929485 RepID=UPI003077D556
KQKGGMAAQGKGIPEKQGARCTPIRLQPHAGLRRICLGAGHENAVGRPAWESFPMRPQAHKTRLPDAGPQGRRAAKSHKKEWIGMPETHEA